MHHRVKLGNIGCLCHCLSKFSFLLAKVKYRPALSQVISVAATPVRTLRTTLRAAVCIQGNSFFIDSVDVVFYHF